MRSASLALICSLVLTGCNSSMPAKQYAMGDPEPVCPKNMSGIEKFSEFMKQDVGVFTLDTACADHRAWREAQKTPEQRADEIRRRNAFIDSVGNTMNQNNQRLMDSVKVPKTSTCYLNGNMISCMTPDLSDTTRTNCRIVGNTAYCQSY